MMWPFTKRKKAKVRKSMSRIVLNEIKSDVEGLKNQINNIDLDNKLNKLEIRLTDRIDNLLGKALNNIQSPYTYNLDKSKTSLKQTQEKRVIQAFRRTKKQLAKERILEMQKNTPIPTIKVKLMQELGISKASFYNYLKELDNEAQFQEVQKSSLSKLSK